MNKIKEWCMSVFGAGAYIVFFLLACFINIFPLIFIDMPFWVDFLLLMGMSAIPFISNFISLAVWIWGLVAAIGGRQDVFAILFYIVFAIKMIDLLINLLSGIFSNRHRY